MISKGRSLRGGPGDPYTTEYLLHLFPQFVRPDSTIDTNAIAWMKTELDKRLIISRKHDQLEKAGHSDEARGLDAELQEMDKRRFQYLRNYQGGVVPSLSAFSTASSVTASPLLIQLVPELAGRSDLAMAARELELHHALLKSGVKVMPLTTVQFFQTRFGAKVNDEVAKKIQTTPPAELFIKQTNSQVIAK